MSEYFIETVYLSPAVPVNNLPHWDEYISFLQKIKLGFNLLVNTCSVFTDFKMATVAGKNLAELENISGWNA